jgi:putative lipoic acid-binding regulatory protein
MQDIESIGAKKEGQGFQFPGEFEIVAMGNATAGLEAKVPEILAAIGLTVLHETIGSKTSKEGNFMSVTVSFVCPTREKYDEAHAALRADPNIRYTM